jgi:cytochrome c peroxidase
VVSLNQARLQTDPLLFHDGRTNGAVRNGRVVLPSTSVQATQPLVNPLEMAFPNGDGQGVERAMQRLRSAGYGPLFKQVYGDGRITAARYGNAMTAYLATLQSNDAPIDRRMRGYSRALSPAAERGFQLVSAAGCMSCHTPQNGRFTDAGFHNNGFAFFSRGRDPGRIGILPDGSPRNNTTVRAFKTPNWEEIQDSGPYMHDGSAPTLESVIEAYQCGMARNAIVNGQSILARDLFIDPRIMPNPWPAFENPNVVQFFKEAFRGKHTNGVKPSLPRGLAVRR